MMNNFEAKLFLGVFSLAITYVKGNFRNMLQRDGRKKSCQELLDELKERVTDLEIKAEYTNSHDEVTVDNPKFETFNEAVERGKHTPLRGWILPGIIPEGSICNLQAVEKAGKSILVTQIAHECAYGLSSSLIRESEKKVSRQEVYIYDSELDDDDMFERYHDFDDDRINRCPNAYFESANAFICHIKKTVSDIDSNVLVIVDNISAICPNYSHKDVQNTIMCIEALQKSFMDRGYRLTIIFVHHTKTGSHGSDKHDSAGSRRWTRLGKLNLALSDTRYGDSFKMLSVVSARNAIEELQPDEALVLELVGEPYSHFEFREVCKNEEAPPERKKPRQQDVDDSNEETSDKKSCSYLDLSEEEKIFIKATYVPNEYGPGRLATDIFEKRGFDGDRRQWATMKSKVNRFVKNIGKQE